MEITNSQVMDEIVNAYFTRRIMAREDAKKRNGKIDKSPGVLVVGGTGTGKSTGVYNAFYEVAKLLGKKPFIYGVDELTLDVDKLAFHYQQLLTKISRVTEPLTKNKKIKAIDEEILKEIIKDTFEDISLDEIFHLVDALSPNDIEEDVPDELKVLRDEVNNLRTKILYGEIAPGSKEYMRFIELEKKYNEMREKIGGYFIMVDFDLNQVESVDMTGVIIRTSLGFRYLPPLWALLLKRHGGFLFLDEFTNVESNEKRSISYRIVFSKKIGDIFLDYNTLVVAAGNTREDSSIASELPKPLLNRFGVLRITSIDVDKTINYLLSLYGKYKAGLRVLSFLASKNSSSILYNLHSERGGNVDASTAKETLEPFETPRSWEYIIRDLVVLNGEIPGPDTDILLARYGLRPGDLTDRSMSNETVKKIVMNVASKYVSQSVAGMLAEAWIEKFIEPEELFKDPDKFREIGTKMNMRSLQTVFMYTNWMIRKFNEETKNLKASDASVLFDKKQKVFEKYMKPLYVIFDVNREYFAFIFSIMASQPDDNIRSLFILSMFAKPEFADMIREIIQKR